MNQPVSKPFPLKLKIIAWVTLALALTTLLNVVVGLIVFSQAPPGTVALGIEAVRRNLLYVGYPIMAFLSITAAVGSIVMLRRRSWGRTLTECSFWGSAIFLITVYAHQIYYYPTYVEGMKSKGLVVDEAFLLYSFIGTGIMMILFFILPLGLCIWILRSRPVREFFLTSDNAGVWILR